MEVDRISNLPEDIEHKILSLLCLRDTVRTSILSSMWRFKWATLPYLVFDEQSVSVSTQDEAKLMSIVDHVLLLHMGPILKFKLSHPITSCRYKLPSSLYSCQNLIHLELYYCLLKLPSNFNGFKSLKSLDLKRINMDQLAFEHMISSCPLLERLTLRRFDGFRLLNIHAPNLLFLDVDGAFDDVTLQDTFNLAVVNIGRHGNEPGLAFRSTGNLINFFASLPHSKSLEIQCYFMKYLAAGTIPGMLPTPCVDLSFLSISINFNVMEENLAAICLLTSSPNLEELEIWAFRPRAAGNIVENFPSFSFDKLRRIKIVGISGIKQEVDFIKFLLANADVLELMIVQNAFTISGWDLVMDLRRARKAESV